MKDITFLIMGAFITIVGTIIFLCFYGFCKEYFYILGSFGLIDLLCYICHRRTNDMLRELNKHRKSDSNIKDQNNTD